MSLEVSDYRRQEESIDISAQTQTLAHAEGGMKESVRTL